MVKKLRNVMSNVKDIYPADSVKHVCDNAASEMETALIVGYDKDGDFCVYGGGLIDGKRPTAKDWLWMIESFKTKLIDGEYST